MRLRLAPVAYKICSECGTHFEGEKCPNDDVPFNEATTRKILKDLMILFGGDSPAYGQDLQYRCKKGDCRNLFPLSMNNCPVCGASRPQRPTVVWERTFKDRTESIEDHLAQERI